MASVDDIDELIATRRLNGVDDGLYESDKNVVNKIKRQVENAIRYYKNIDNIEEVPIDILRAMYQDILEERKQDKKRIKELEEDLYIANYTVENSISIQKINDKIEKYEHMLALTALGEIQKYTPGEVLLKIDTLKELLEENNK